jgi:hypothetical protein
MSFLDNTFNVTEPFYTSYKDKFDDMERKYRERLKSSTRLLQVRIIDYLLNQSDE